MWLAAVLLVAFTAIASIDGLYFHLYRYRLWERADSRYEHLLHTLNACLFVPQVVLIFCVRPGGAWLWAAALVSLLILGVELADVLCERDSRRALGGLTPAEYAMHFLMSGLRLGFLSIFFSTVSMAQLLGPATLARGPLWMLGACIAVPGVPVATLHVWLALAGRAPASLPSRDARATS